MSVCMSYSNKLLINIRHTSLSVICEPMPCLVPGQLGCWFTPSKGPRANISHTQKQRTTTLTHNFVTRAYSINPFFISCVLHGCAVLYSAERETDRSNPVTFTWLHSPELLYSYLTNIWTARIIACWCISALWKKWYRVRKVMKRGLLPRMHSSRFPVVRWIWIF